MVIILFDRSFFLGWYTSASAREMFPAQDRDYFAG